MVLWITETYREQNRSSSFTTSHVRSNQLKETEMRLCQGATVWSNVLDKMRPNAKIIAQPST